MCNVLLRRRTHWWVGIRWVQALSIPIAGASCTTPHDGTETHFEWDLVLNLCSESRHRNTGHLACKVHWRGIISFISSFQVKLLYNQQNGLSGFLRSSLVKVNDVHSTKLYCQPYNRGAVWFQFHPIFADNKDWLTGLNHKAKNLVNLPVIDVDCHVKMISLSLINYPLH